MKKIISALILASLLSSCVTRRACERRFTDLGANVSTTDSTNTLTVIRDTTILVKIPGDTVGTSVLLNDVVRLNSELPSLPLTESSLSESSKLGAGHLGVGQLGVGQLGATQSSVTQSNVSTLSTRLSKSTIWLKDGRLHHRLEQKDTTVSATIKGALKTTHKTSITRSQKERTIQQTRYANQLTGWQWTQVYLGRMLLVILTVLLLWKILRS